MYVMPFWSYRTVPGGCVVTNWLTRRSAPAPAGLVDLLEAVYGGLAGGGPAPDDGLLGLARSLELVFDSEGEADAWLAEVERGWLRDFPVVDQIELTNRCPYSCKMCPRTFEMDRQLGDMPLDLFERIVGQLGGRQSYVALHHFGESLLHPGLARAVAVAREAGLRTGLSCNPPTLRPELAARLLEAGIANIVLSLDSLDPDAYREIRGPAARSDRADANLRELVRLRDEGGHGAFITLQMISMRRNEAEADRFLDYCREVGVDRGVVIRLGRWDFDDAFVEQLGDFTSAGYDGYCKRPWDSLVVLWDGRVVPCCHDYNGEVVLGDLREQSVEEVWHSAAAREFRERNLDYQLCRKCAFSRWARERQREREGFRRFHCERAPAGRAKEWLNPQAAARLDGREMFDGFDVLTDG